MGFVDRREILSVLRSSHRPWTLDDAMIAIVTAREEAAEARKMDEARLASERTRKAEAAARRQANKERHEEQIRQSGLDEWLFNASMFPHSWLLRSVARPKLEEELGTIKDALIALLELEKKSHQWYKDLPSAYFDMLARQLLSATDVPSFLKRETQTLQQAMFELSQQQGGVPKILLQAHERMEESDDEVVVLEVRCPPSPE